MHVTQLNLAHLKVTPLRSGGPFNNFTDANDLFALHALRLCFNHYVEDIKKCVKEGVSKAISLASESERSERQRALERWLKNASPFSFHFNSPDIEDLHVAVCGYDPNALEHGLPPIRNVRLSMHQLASAIFEGVSPLHSTTIRAPFLPQGTFQLILKQTIKNLYDMNVERLRTETTDWLILQICRVLEAFKYKAIPWSPSDSRQRLACWNQWALVNVASKELATERITSTSRHHSAVQNALSKAIHRQLQDDPTIPWTLEQVEITDLPLILTRGSLPAWDLPFRSPANVSEDSNDPNTYVYKTFEWAQANFDIKKPTHYLALAVGVIFAKLCPYLSHDPSELVNNFNAKTTAEMARTSASNLTWLNNPKLSTRDAGKIACTFITTTMALTDSDSPLLKRMLGGKGALGKEWMNKTSKYTCTRFIDVFTAINDLLPVGARKISLFQLFRANILNAQGSMNSMVFGKQCWRKTDTDYSRMAANIHSILSDPNSSWAVGDVVTKILGQSAGGTLSAVASLKTRQILGKRPRAMTYNSDGGTTFASSSRDQTKQARAPLCSDDD
jgi:hypothetical protein